MYVCERERVCMCNLTEEEDASLAIDLVDNFNGFFFPEVQEGEIERKCVCVCVCEREREKERKSVCVIYIIFECMCKT